MDENELIKRALKEAAFVVAVGILIIVSLEAWSI